MFLILIIIRVWPPCLFLQGATKVAIRDKAGVLTSLMGLMIRTVIIKVINSVIGYQNKALRIVSKLETLF